MQLLICEPHVNIKSKKEMAPPMLNAQITSAGVIRENASPGMEALGTMYSLRIKLHTSPETEVIVLMAQGELESLQQQLKEVLPALHLVQTMPKGVS